MHKYALICSLEESDHVVDGERSSRILEHINAKDHEGCKALAGVLSQVGDKWTILVVGVLSLGPLRFNAMQRAIPGISHRMLTHTLRGLERDGLLKRTVFGKAPLRVEYQLTSLGTSLTAPLAGLAAWAAEHKSLIEQARQTFDQEAS